MQSVQNLNNSLR